MKLRHLAVAALLAVGAANITGAAFAQSKVFVIDEDAIRAGSKIGKDIAVKLGESQKEGVTKLGLQALSAEIKTAEDALKPQTESLTPEALKANPTLKARVDELNKKKVEFLKKQDFLNANLEQQGNAGMVAFATALAPAVDYVAKQAGADVVLSSSATWYIKDAVDLSPKVIARLDATTPTLEALKAAAQAAQPPKAP